MATLNTSTPQMSVADIRKAISEDDAVFVMRLNSPKWRTDPQPRFAETIEFTLADILTTEDQDARETAQLAAVASWLKESN